MTSDAVILDIPAWQLRGTDNIIEGGLAFSITSIMRGGEYVHVTLDAHPFPLRRTYSAAHMMEIARP